MVVVYFFFKILNSSRPLHTLPVNVYRKGLFEIPLLGSSHLFSWFPSRVVHAKAAGAFGYFECTHDVTDITSATFLSKVGTRTPALVRISTVGSERGSADTVRDVRGWGIKLFTTEGNQDWVFNDIVRKFSIWMQLFWLSKPVFFVRDPIKFPSLNRSHKRHPQTNLPDANMVSTILSHRSEMSANPFVVLEVSLLVQKYEYADILAAFTIITRKESMLSCVCSAIGEPQPLSEILTLSVGTLTSLPNRSVWDVSI